MRGIWLDRRIGGLPRWRLCDDSELMRVPDDLRDCTCFITTVRNGRQTGIASAFFVGVELGILSKATAYLVTAKHCLYDRLGLADEIVIWLNTHAGGIAQIHTQATAWRQHPTADVAVIHALPNPEVFALRAYPGDGVATQSIIQDKAIGPGDDVFITGLLVHHPGQTRIMPIVRLGTIAALPEDPVRMRIGPHVGADVVNDVAALVEARSIGGLSGSPVYVHLPFWRDAEKGQLFVGQGGKAGIGGEHWLLGVMHGFYPVGANDPDAVSGGDENLNTGIAVVVLADRVLDLINHPDERRVRDHMKEEVEEGQTPTPTPASAPSADEFDEFEGLARKLVNVPKDEIDKKRNEA